MTLLIEKTITEFGWDPRLSPPSSHSMVAYTCACCHEERTIRIRYYRGDSHICKPCPAKDYKKPRNVRPRWMLPEPNPISELPDNIDRAATFSEFGYYPEYLTSGSAQKVIWRCAHPDCSRLSASEMKVVRSLTLCRHCVQIDFMKVRNAATIASGFAPNGKPLGQRDKVKYRETGRLWREEWRSTEVGTMINRLRVALKRVSKGESTKSLPYTPMDFVEHIRGRLAAYGGVCPLCKVTPIVYSTCDVDHKIPLSTATTPEEALALFALDNLDVLCPHCNQFVKRDRTDVIYWNEK